MLSLWPGSEVNSSAQESATIACAGSGAFIASEPQSVQVDGRPKMLGPWLMPSSPGDLQAIVASPLTDARVSAVIDRSADGMIYARVRFEYPYKGYAVPFSIETIRMEWREDNADSVRWAELDLTSECSSIGRALFPGGDWTLEFKLPVQATTKTLNALRVWIIGQRS